MGEIENVVYWGMDWFCPPYHQQMHDRIEANWGEITAENTMRDIIPRTNTGNMHVTVYDYNNWDMYVAFARQDKNKDDEGLERLNAWERSYTRLPMEEIFNLVNPTPTTTTTTTEEPTTTTVETTTTTEEPTTTTTEEPTTTTTTTTDEPATTAATHIVSVSIFLLAFVQFF